MLAHELYHIFAKTAHHGSRGAAKGIYSVADMLTHSFGFEERESQALRNNKPRAIVEITDGTH